MPRASSIAASSAPGGHDAVHEADPFRFDDIDLAAGQDQVEGTTETHDQRKPHRASVDQGNAPASFQAPEPGSVTRHPEITPGRQLHAPGDAPSLHGGDHRLGQIQPGGPHGAAVAQAGQVGEIGSGAEGLLVAGEDGDLGPRVGVEGQQLVVQSLGGLGVHRVASLGPIDPHHPHAVVDHGPDRTGPQVCDEVSAQGRLPAWHVVSRPISPARWWW